MQLSRPADTYNPLYFLASVGAGGLSVTFFMYLMFWVPHPGRPVPIFEDLFAVMQSGSMGLKLAVVVAWVGIAAMVFLNLKYLVWNLKQFSAFKQTDAYQTLKNSNAETTILAMPLALAMSVNGMFVAGLVFVPGLWVIVEYLFPLAMLAFLAIGVLALRIIGDFLGRVLTKGGVFDVTAHNSFAQMLPAFALSMVAVGFAAPAAMSHTTAVVAISLVGSTFFGTAAIVYALVALVTAFNSMLHYGTSKESAPTLMIVIPILTVLGIMFMRQTHGLHETFEVHSSAAESMVFLARLVTIQILFAALGLVVLARQGYWKSFVFGSDTSPGSYALVCPGVALSVLTHFLLNAGMVKAGVVDKFSLIYWAVSAIAIALQFAMVALVVRLNKQHFGRGAAIVQPAE
ncbi:TsoY family (seleno)protein [Aliiroseovarius crassostreae]|uniref:TsoY family (seleno)protein n=1 Tax=Aliiroseovarius crassostreae TaxID=154981 RepID=UPI003C7B8FB9